MLDGVDGGEDCEEGVHRLIDKNFVDRDSMTLLRLVLLLNRIHTLRQTNQAIAAVCQDAVIASAIMINAVDGLKAVLSWAKFEPALPLYIGLEPNAVPNQKQKPYGPYSSASDARIRLEEHCRGGADPQRGQLRLRWQRNAQKGTVTPYFSGRCEARRTDDNKPADDTGLGMG